MMWITGIIAGIWLDLSPALADDIDTDPQPNFALIARGCMGCHGIDGNNRAGMASIAAMDPEVMYKILVGYRDGTRESTIMGRLMRPFSNDDIDDLAQFFAHLPSDAASSP